MKTRNQADQKRSKIGTGEQSQITSGEASNAKRVQVSILIPRELQERLLAAAERLKVTPEAFIERAVKEFVGRRLDGGKGGAK